MSVSHRCQSVAARHSFLDRIDNDQEEDMEARRREACWPPTMIDNGICLAHIYCRAVASSGGLSVIHVTAEKRE